MIQPRFAHRLKEKHLIINTETKSQICLNIEKGRNALDWLDKDPLNDTTSHTPMRSSEPLR